MPILYVYGKRPLILLANFLQFWQLLKIEGQNSAMITTIPTYDWAEYPSTRATIETRNVFSMRTVYVRIWRFQDADGKYKRLKQIIFFKKLKIEKKLNRKDKSKYDFKKVKKYIYGNNKAGNSDIAPSESSESSACVICILVFLVVGWQFITFLLLSHDLLRERSQSIGIFGSVPRKLIRFLFHFWHFNLFSKI